MTSHLDFSFYSQDGEFVRRVGTGLTCYGDLWEKWELFDLLQIEFEFGTIDSFGEGDNLSLQSYEISDEDQDLVLARIKTELDALGITSSDWSELDEAEDE